MALKDDDFDRPPDATDFLAVSGSIGKEWKRLGRELGIEDATLEEIEEKNRAYGFQEMAYQTIVIWQQINGNKASAFLMQQHLYNIGRRDIELTISSGSLSNKTSSDATCSCLSPTPSPDINQLPTSLLVEVADLLGKDWKRLGRKMDFPEVALLSIEDNYRIDGIEEMAYQLLLSWKKRKPLEATKDGLKDHLMSIARKDIISRFDTLTSAIFKESNESSNTTFGSIQGLIDKVNTIRQKRLLLKNLRRSLANEYRSLQMIGLPWMDELVLTLDDYYVELSMMQLDKNGRIKPIELKLKKMFVSVNRKIKHSRILVEGGPGMGKTTLAAKLAYDWSRKKSYLRKFNLVILLPLRHFDGEFFDMVCRAVGFAEKDRQQFFEIINDPNKCILFILDGYDEASTETKVNIFPLLLREQYASAFVVVTSRSGKFTFIEDIDTIIKDRILAGADVRPTGNKFFDQNVTIRGLGTKQQRDFVNKHMVGYSKEQITFVENKLTQMVEKEFSKCPLFLLMLIIVFTSGENTEFIHTKTDLYKHVFNWVIRRYCCKTSNLLVENMELFSAFGNDVPLHVELMREFGKFALCAIKTASLQFSLHEIIKTENFDLRILNLGFLIETISVKGFRKNTVYEPVHKSLLEFAAAYSLWTTFTEELNELWEKDIISLRPQLETACSSLLFPFLMGLMGVNSAAVFNVLAPYASEYTSWFGTLGFSLLEIPMTEFILTSLTPFLPAEWLVKWFPVDNGFSNSNQHEHIVRWGTQQGKIKIIRWDIQHPARLPKDVVLETIVLTLTTNYINDENTTRSESHATKSYTKRQHIRNVLQEKTCCRYLWYQFATQSECVNLWQNCLDMLKAFDYQHLCFDFLYLSNWFTCIHETINKGKLPDIIYSVKVAYFLQNADSNELMTQIIDTISGANIEHLTLFVDKNCPQTQIDTVVNIVSKSLYLSSFSLISNAKPSTFIVDLVKLFDGSLQQWDLVRLDGVQVQCLGDIKNSSTTKLINVVIPTISFLPTDTLCTLQMTSFTCHCSMLSYVCKAFPHLEAVIELNVILDKSVLSDGFVGLPKKLEKLTVLILIVTDFECRSFTLPTTDWLFDRTTLPRLKGLEIWKIEENPLFASVLIHYVIRCLDERSYYLFTSDSQITVSSLNSTSLHLDYILFKTPLTHDPQNLTVSSTTSDNVAKFISTITLIKKYLVAKILPRLDMVHVIRSRHFWPYTFGSLMNIFPPTEGFTVERDLWGSKKNDTIYSQEMHVSSPGRLERISVTFKNIVDK